MKLQIDEQQFPELTPDNYINRELSWIEFNARVLEQAKDESLPLLERAKFLAIFSNNFDEFFMVRVAYVHSKAKVGLGAPRPDGYTPAQVLKEIRQRTMQLVHEQRAIMRDVLARLDQSGVRILELRQLTAPQRGALRQYYYEEVYPVLTPL